MNCNKPIRIIFSSVNFNKRLENENYFKSTIEINIRIDKDDIMKYIDKKITIKDLFTIIKNRI